MQATKNWTGWMFRKVSMWFVLKACLLIWNSGGVGYWSTLGTGRFNLQVLVPHFLKVNFERMKYCWPWFSYIWCFYIKKGLFSDHQAPLILIWSNVAVLADRVHNLFEFGCRLIALITLTGNCYTVNVEVYKSLLCHNSKNNYNRSRNFV